MLEEVVILVNGRELAVPAGTVVAAALWAAGAPCRISATGQPRAALCGMGICFECSAIVDGSAHRRTCQILCRPGMRIETQS